VRDWIREDAPKYNNVEVVYIDNLDPVLKLMDEKGAELASVVCSFLLMSSFLQAISTFKRKEIGTLLRSSGILTADESK
jgi:hypothetical protein